MTIDWTLIVPTIIVLAVTVFVLKAVRKVKEKLHKKLGPAPSELAMKQLLEQIKNRELPKCPRCHSETFAMLDSDSRYKCESCHFEFEGATHI